MSDNRTEKIREIISAIGENESFLVATHVRPDGDAIGAVLGMKLMLERLGKRADAFCRDGFPPEFGFLPAADTVRARPPAEAGYDAAILVDCGDFDRVGDELAEFIGSRVPVVINIDHHISGAPFGTVHWVDTGTSSTCEMLFEICMRLSLTPDPDIAALLYTGILTDTGSFRFSNTNRRVFEVATVLVEAGADPAYIAQEVYDSTSPEKLGLLALVLGTVEFHARSRIATAELTRRMLSSTGATHMESEGFINHLRSVKSVAMAILFREGGDGVIHVSLRSRDGVDVARFAQRHGGGGHRQAAACRIAGTLAVVREMVINEAVEYVG
ncbi:MAG: bifunctional oligoribonuclease/PAP phosphatase NrnA [Syntrophobacteraceae bacterium]